MAFDHYELDDSYNTRIRDSLNTNTTTSSTANIAADLDNVGNYDGSTSDSHNVGVDVSDSGNYDSHDTDVDVDADIRHSFNDDSDNSTDDHTDNSADDHSDNSTNHSYNDNSDHSTRGSYNDYSQNWTDSHAVSAGNRSYDLSGAGGGEGGGSVTFIDQSVNSNIDAWRGVGQESSNSAVVASGEGALAAGGDIRIDQDYDGSTSFRAGGDINIDNTTDVTTTAFSYNTTTDASTYESNDLDVDIDDSFNSDSQEYTADNSFNAELDNVSTSDWDIDANVIWGSDLAVVADDVSVDDVPE